MAFTFSLKVNQMDTLPAVEGKEDVVVRAHWVYVGTDGKGVGTFGGSTEIPLAKGKDFIPFADLTEEQVAEWVIANWAPHQKATYEEAIKNQALISAPKLPWAPMSKKPPVA